MASDEQKAREDALIEAVKEACAVEADEERKDWKVGSSGGMASRLIGNRIRALTPESIRQRVKGLGE